MAQCKPGNDNKRSLVLSGLLLLFLFCLQITRGDLVSRPLGIPALVHPAHATPVLQNPAVSETIALQISDPLAYLQKARRSYNTKVRDYICTFSKQELLGTQMSRKQVADVKFREGLFSVYMHIHTNPAKARPKHGYGV